jgi:DNA polymerase III alpha subunit (gram-positive type)
MGKRNTAYTLFGRNITFLDYETTGLNTDTDELVSVYAVNPKLKWEIDSLAKPSKMNSAEALAVNGITEAMLENAPSNAIITRAVTELWNSSDIICGWNTLGYDAAMTFSLCKRENVVIDRFNWHLDMKYVCKLLLNTEEEKKAIGDFRLVNVYRYLFDEDFNAHNAKADVLATMRIFCKMKPYIENHHLLTYQSVKGEVITSPQTELIQGKYLGQPFYLVAESDASYIKWLMKKDMIRVSQSLINKYNLTN